MTDRKIPTEWLFLKFTEILDVQGGTQPPKSQFIGEPREGYIRLLQIRDFGKKPVPTFIPDTSKLKKCNKDDLLIGRYGASLGRICTGMEGAYNVALAKVIMPPSVDRGFLHGYLGSEHFQGELRLLSRSAQNGFNKGDLETFDFLLPPLAEQKVIADKLDTLLAQVENTKARLERVPQILKRFRQSVLAAAVSGRLTEEWRNGAEFEVESDALSKFVSIDIGHAFKSKEFTDRGISLLRGQNIEPGALRWSETKYFPEAKLSEFRHLFINSGDIVLAMDRPIISSGLKIARAKPSDLPCVLVQRVARFKDFNDLLPDYLYVLLQDISFSNYIQPNQTGSDIPHISGKQILAYPVEIPSIEEQTEIVRRVDQLFAHADRIEQQVNNALARVNNLTQSILAKAFRGELTEQWRKDNPELITGENSAEALLDRIKAERAAMKPVKKSRQKRTTA
ncbi:restriction endonuclease subunit S [Vreelandella lionensis]|uniref:Restriction endonuclease subunit S n=1 Tax=Vreelandella lionensis TaxID=1144478 RepID=A0ABW8BUT6_9GAMM